MMKSIKQLIKKAFKNYYLYKAFYLIRYYIPYIVLGEDRYAMSETIRKWKKYKFIKPLNLDHPQTLNEKIQWLKLNVKENFHTICADKLTSRKYWVDKIHNESYLVPLLFYTYDWKDIRIDVLPDEPFVIKSSSGSDSYHIIRNKKSVNIKQLRNDCRRWLCSNYYLISQEWQYKNVKPAIIIEKLLLDKNGRIPNDYKFHYMNGELAFVYCAVDREGTNYRSIYSPDWKMMDVEWVSSNSHAGAVGAPTERPYNYEEMIRISSIIAKDFKYVRVDFYEVDKKLYYGEITLHHGSGYDHFIPEKWDEILGSKLQL